MESIDKWLERFWSDLAAELKVALLIGDLRAAFDRQQTVVEKYKKIYEAKRVSEKQIPCEKDERLPKQARSTVVRYTYRT